MVLILNFWRNATASTVFVLPETILKTAHPIFCGNFMPAGCRGHALTVKEVWRNYEGSMKVCRPKITLQVASL